MNKLSDSPESDKPNPRDDWPPWTNDVAYWPTGPTRADSEWAAENLNGDDLTDEMWDALAEAAAQQDRLERGQL